MLIEDMIIYLCIAATLFVVLYIGKLVFFPKQKEVRKQEHWTFTPPTAALPVSQMKNASRAGLKGVNKKNIMSSNKDTGEKKKAANWKEVASFDEDVKQINLDNVLNKRKPFEKNTDLSKGAMENKIDYKLKVLLVDDSAVILKKTGDMLKSNNFEVITKKDGAEALEWLKSNNQIPEVVITDMEMPKMTGEDLVIEMRQDERFKSIPVLVISAHAEKHIALMEKQMIQGFLRKPFTESDIMFQIDYFLNHN